MGLVPWLTDCCWWQRKNKCGWRAGDWTQTSYSRTAWKDSRMGHEGPYLKNICLKGHLPCNWKITKNSCEVWQL